MKLHPSSFLLASAAITIAALPLVAAEPAFDAHLPATPATVVLGSYSNTVAPALTIQPGQTVKIDTLNSTELNREDYLTVIASAGIPPETPFIRETLAVLAAADKESVERGGTIGRILTGPIYITGAEPGDVLEVRVIDVVVRSDFAINRTTTNMGPLLAASTPAPEARVYPLDRAKNKARIGGVAEISLWPFLGEMGIAGPPDRGNAAADRPTKLSGGAFDCPDLGRGASIFYPVHVPGARFFAGGGKAAGANGKVNGFGLEVPATGYLQFIVHKGMKLSAVRAETPLHYVTFAPSNRLDIAMRDACLGIVEFLGEKAGLDFFHAYSLGSLAIDFNVTRSNPTGMLMHMTIPKSIFVKDAKAYWYTGDIDPRYLRPGYHSFPGKQRLQISGM